MIVESEKGFYFTTEQDSSYWVYFTEAGGLVPSASFASNALTLGFQNLSKTQIVQNSDARIQASILLIIYRFLLKYPDKVIFFTCDDSGYVQGELVKDVRLAKRRSEIFSFWFNTWKQGDELKINKIDFIMQYGGTTYISCLFRQNHPNQEEIEEVIRQTVVEKQL